MQLLPEREHSPSLLQKQTDKMFFGEYYLQSHIKGKVAVQGKSAHGAGEQRYRQVLSSPRYCTQVSGQNFTAEKSTSRTRNTQRQSMEKGRDFNVKGADILTNVLQSDVSMTQNASKWSNA